MLITDTWDDCVKRYEYLKQHEHWAALAAAMLKLIEDIRQDRSFPETLHVVSHAWLRIGPVVQDSGYRPSVWVGWRKPNYYWMGIGSFGTQRRITVTADNAVPMLKRYLALLAVIDPEFALIAPAPMPESASDEDEAVDQWSKDALEAKYAHLSTDEVLPALAEDISGQVDGVREIADQLRDLIAGLEELDAAQAATQSAAAVVGELLKRADRIGDLLAAGMERRPQPRKIAPAPEPEPAVPALSIDELIHETFHLNGAK